MFEIENVRNRKLWQTVFAQLDGTRSPTSACLTLNRLRSSIYYLLTFIFFFFFTQAQVDKYAKHCYKQLERICVTGAKRGLKGPTTDEIQSAIVRNLFPKSLSLLFIRRSTKITKWHRIIVYNFLKP